MERSIDPLRGYVVQGGESYVSKQGPEYTPGVSAETVGAKALFLGVVTLAPGAQTSSHVHERHESAFYMLSGEAVEWWTGDVAVNRSKTVPAIFVGARNEPTAQESVVMRPELNSKIA
jgi:uncharacterized RmlC-like cupin family protein